MTVMLMQFVTIQWAHITVLANLDIKEMDKTVLVR